EKNGKYWLDRFEVIANASRNELEVWERASPTYYINSVSPQTLIVHGDLDAIIPWSQSRRLADVLRAHNVTQALLRMRTFGHGLHCGFYGLGSQLTVSCTGEGYIATVSDILCKVAEECLGAEQWEFVEKVAGGVGTSTGWMRRYADADIFFGDLALILKVLEFAIDIEASKASKAADAASRRAPTSPAPFWQQRRGRTLNALTDELELTAVDTPTPPPPPPGLPPPRAPPGLPAPETRSCYACGRQGHLDEDISWAPEDLRGEVQALAAADVNAILELVALTDCTDLVEGIIEAQQAPSAASQLPAAPDRQ
ncbi:hypothetical protein CYMTET_8842, partial [Cymbomonas tetramitiformis]